MVHFVVRIANDPARRFKLLYDLVCFGIAALFVVIGAGYALGGRNAVFSPHALGLLESLERPIGGLHAHGIILLGLGLLLAYGSGNFRRSTRIALQLTSFYSLLTAILIISGWWFFKIDFPRPWWYVFTSFLSITLLVLAPPLDERGRAYRGGSDSA